MRIVETKNIGTLQHLVEDDDIFDAISDDSTDGNRDVAPFVSEGSLCLEVEDGGSAEGVFVFRPVSEGIVEMHTIMGKTCRGKKALQAGKLAVDYVKSKGYGIVGYTFSDSPAQLWFAKKLGFSESSRSVHSTTRHGKPVDLIHLILY